MSFGGGCTKVIVVPPKAIMPAPAPAPAPVQVPHKSSWMLRSEFSTSLRKAGTGKIHNVKLAAEILEGHIIRPGEMFSYNEVVGSRDKTRGFLDAPSFLNKKVVKSVGGGVCQLSSTLHGAIVLAETKVAGIEVVERHKHSLPVHYCPSWAEATVSYGSKDLKFINNTGSDIRIATRVVRENGVWKLTVEIWQKAETSRR